MKDKITHEELLRIVHYDPLTGVFTAKIDISDKTRQGKVLGCLSKTSGYILIRLNHVLYRAHRLAWMYMNGEWPSLDVDHKDRDRSNNTYSNLRLADKSQNASNAKLSKNSSTGRKGVCWSKARQKFQANIHANRKTTFLGYFDTIEEAGAEYDVAAQKAYGPFALTNETLMEGSMVNE